MYMTHPNDEFYTCLAEYGVIPVIMRDVENHPRTVRVAAIGCTLLQEMNLYGGVSRQAFANYCDENPDWRQIVEFARAIAGRDPHNDADISVVENPHPIDYEDPRRYM